MRSRLTECAWRVPLTPKIYILKGAIDYLSSLDTGIPLIHSYDVKPVCLLLVAPAKDVFPISSLYKNPTKITSLE